ncbi:MAG TPA: aminotransferase class V-fold PLP-dependent enzyme [Acetobacteraceae bacterium]|nr:aminotransferase class V-fold PLP-dependent enzyme [Acetobacteraceae bacterium]
MGTGSPSFDVIRTREFPISRDEIYLDNAGRGLLPRSHVEAVSGFLRQMSDELPSQDLSLVIEETRQRVARLLNCGTEGVALLSTTSQGLNLVPAGLDWRVGDEVILYEMDHPTDVYAWLNLADRGVTVRFVKDRGGWYEAEDVERLIGPRTRAVCLSLVNYGHGFRAPMEAIGEICRRRGLWLVVDAIMALGALRVDAQAIEADIIAAHGYKFLLSGFGVAACYCSPRAREELRISEVGYKAMERIKDYVTGPPDFTRLAGEKLAFSATARRFEAGTQALAMMAGMKATLDLMLSVGAAAIESRILDLAALLTEGLLAKGYEVAGSIRPGERSAIVSFAGRGLGIAEASRELTAHRIRHHILHQRIRLSPHFYNNRSDIAAAITCL